MCLTDEQMKDTILYARVAQLVEHDLAKVGAAGSSPVSRSLFFVGSLDFSSLPFFCNVLTTIFPSKEKQEDDKVIFLFFMYSLSTNG